jgi:GAF domain-containing protein
MNQFLSETTTILASAGESHTVLQRLAQSFVPSQADFCFIHLADNHHLRCVAAAHATRAGRKLVRGLARLYRIKPNDPLSTVAQVVRSGRAQLRSEIAAEHGPGLPRVRVFDLHRQLAPQSAIVVPLAGRDHVLGALTMCYGESRRHYTAHDLTHAKRLARQIAAYLAKPLLRPTAAAPRRLLVRARI